ncbi:MAG: ThiF family adenylyltransferase [Sulfurovaceae bacterium]|nr:ThiF family adenylyltransferase [Sulfurovaceae bacterium]MDD5548013.1 ThiF family adenylyltransferase [Sulfurovaceae bacterium]
MTQEKYFHRQIQLWGDEVQECLQDKKIAIIGAGGLGSSLALALGTSGIGHIDIVDFDKVSLHNIHRQIAFTLKDQDKYKAKVVTSLVKSKNPFVNLKSIISTFEEFSHLEGKYDLIIDATDNLQTRIQIDTFAKKQSTPWIYGSVEAWHGYVCFFEKSSFNSFNVSDHKPAGITAPIVMHIASLQANLALRYLAGLSVAKDKLYYLYFDDNGELITQKFGLPKI